MLRRLAFSIPIALALSGYSNGNDVPAVDVVQADGKQARETNKSSESIEKTSRQTVWQATSDGVQIPLWPEATELAKPDAGDHPE
jgi:hypothetical protein